MGGKKDMCPFRSNQGTEAGIPCSHPWQRSEKSSAWCEGWMIKYGSHGHPLGAGRRKKNPPDLVSSVFVGFLKLAFSETKEVESWLGRVWGKMAMGVKMMGANTAFIQLGSNKEVAEVVMR